MSMPIVAAAAAATGRYPSPYSVKAMELVKRRWENNRHSNNMTTVLGNVLRLCSPPWLWWWGIYGVNWMWIILHRVAISRLNMEHDRELARDVFSVSGNILIWMLKSSLSSVLLSVK
ncbi:PREDICTED: uncharacterized protein LOC105976366 isoform X1 [Erythranthe guttata]|uniref:uncharacterized protein LOC105976366 isoform X1 n=1 Tax=Erythranthe guttata TaxID=4155 RepID=UPI00064DC09B|nr:PREDICTED: uncharacterized protein LOC105976366 isoform X1 [Erythranthe guttata]|eukprot:XP_012857088.1 PREDICTED: uncharacterized protein LOC105976366 isoform X1 [Erythranthe guttata]